MISCRKILIIAVTLSTLVVSCSVEKNRGLLSFFFDGVPQPDSISAIIDESDQLVGTAGEPGDSTQARVIPVYNLHYPYEEKECMSCHDENSPGEMVLTEPDLCYMCHDDFSNLYEALHAAIELGFCTSCHNAHQSRNDYLLNITGQPLCTSCHDLDQVKQNEMHSDIGDTECTLCHNPHGGTDKYLMR